MDHEFSGMDRIHIRDLLLRCVIGVNPGERDRKQDVVTNVTVYADLSAAGRSDAISDTVNYSLLRDRLVKLVEESSYHLIERLAEEIASTCLSFDGVNAARVLVEKPTALRFARTVGVEILRSR
jgi:D-erythro-7,8-dihydroneopterin triphosphate epimerase